MALSHEILWREEKSSIPFDYDFIYLENWNLPSPPFPGELFKILSLALFYSSIHLALARRPEASRSPSLLGPQYIYNFNKIV